MSRSPATSFTDLLVWQKAHALVLAIYALTNALPKHELFGLTFQMRRAAFSVPANIAESFRRRGRDKVRFLNIAASSLGELQYYLILAGDLGYAAKGILKGEADEVSRMLSAYERTILLSVRTQTLRTVFLVSVFCVLSSTF